ncbi:Cadherin EGF LAG seven-pass G-type receptor 2 [Blomia tropicalis]|nr:Cadherin EGF LAG seven-pass G-type receptor 2 [Blomia tropicalis]
MVSSPPQPPPPPTMASLNVVVDDENHRTRSTIMSHHYRISYFCSIVFYLQISLLLTTCSTAWALRLYVPSELNYPSSVLANLSLPTPRMYRMSGDLNAPFIHRFVDVTTIDGMLFLKHTLRCRSESPRDVVTSPLNLYIESRSYSIEGSSNHLTLLHVQLYFDHETCFNTINEMKSRPHLDLDNMINTNPEIIFTKQLQQQQQTSSVSYALLSLNNDRLCVDKCQFLARLPNLIPTSMKNQCKMVYSVIGSNWIDEQFKLEHSTNDLISLQHECINHGSSFNVQIGLLYSCDQHSTKHHYHHHNRKHQQTTWLPSEKVEIIQLTFYAREVDIEQFILQLQQSALQHNHHHHINSSPTRHVYIDHSTTINENQNNNNNNASFVNESGNRSRREASSSSSQHSSGPTFDRSLYIVSVPEEREKSFVVTQIVANPSTPSDDRASTELLYTMSALIDARSQSMFAIDPVSGLVTTTTRLDREFMDVHYLRITVTDSHVPPHSASTTLQVNVLDENDHVPVFEHANYEWSLKESAPIGTTVLTVRATDHDSGPNSDIEYSLLNPTGSNEAFRIDPKQGVIVTRTSLDRERIDQYTLTVQATDSGPIQSRKRSQTNVGIKILDENDNYPQFAERSYSVSVDEDINYASRPVIIRVVSHDADEGMNAAVRYSIIGGNTAAVFQIDSLNGEVSVVGPLDYENSRSYRLVIRAQDGGSPPRSNTTQLLVNVIDKNDNEPRFYTSVFQENVLENVPIGTSVVRVQAYDADDGENSQLSYHIQMGKNTMAMDESLNSMMPIAIDPTTGWIVTTRELDREEASLYEFSVVARDAGTPIQHTATASVIIRVQDLNDNAPVFEPRNYDAVIPETAVPGTPVVTVAATDRDENSRLVFQITGGNVRNRFAIVSQNNQGHITVANLLDYKVEKSYILTVTATDPGGKMDLATVYINVTDANTHRPVIQLKNGAGTYGSTTTTIAEDAPVGTTVMVVEASDDDVGENARITYSLNDVGEFRIDPNSGAIVTTKQLDRETNAGYTLVVTAQDNGIPPLSDIANIEIEVIDVNDNVPQFEQEFYSANVMEDAPIGTSVAHVRAHDRDLGLNGQVRYEFDPTMFASIDGTNPNGVFVIDPTSGVIRTNKSLDRETTAKYDLKVIAFDRGTPSLSSTIVVQVTIDDCNDNPPRFASDRLRFYVPENSPIGSVVGELRATDADVGPNAKIEYTIVGGPDMKWFALKSGSTSSSSSPSALALTDHSQQSAIDSMQSNHDSSSSSSSVALLITRTEMDFESEKKIYNIIVRASSLPLRNDVDVEIHVTDVNDHAPLLRDFSIVFNNYRGHFPLGQVIGRVPAYDADVADQLRYRFVSGNKANLLLLNETTGDLRLSPSLNTNVPTRALLEVSVSDSINEAVARCFLSVNLVTEAMLFHSVTIRLNRVGRRHFLSSLYERFLEGLASVIPCPKENIIIFNIQDDTESENNSILNISFSARLSESLRDTESYHSPQFLQERVYLSRTLLTRLTDLEVLPFDDNLCVREPCLNYEECLSVLKFGNASDFFATEAMLFRAISPVNTFACRCPNGFQGRCRFYNFIFINNSNAAHQNCSKQPFTLHYIQAYTI